LKKPNGNDVTAGFLKADSIYTVRYNGTNFILQGSDSAGNATPEHVLAGKTFSNDAGTDLTGTMPNHGAKIITPSTVNQAIPAGYHNGQGYVVGSPNLIPANIKNGVNIFGVVGSLPNVDDVVLTSYPGTFAGIDNDYIYTTDDPRGVDHGIWRYNHAGTLISSRSFVLETSYVRGTYNREGAIFTKRSSNNAIIFNHDGALLYSVELLGNFSSSYTPMAGYVNGKIVYPTDTSIRLETIGGTLLSTYNPSSSMCYMFSNFKESIVVFKYDDQSTVCYIPRNGNSIISSGFLKRVLLGHLRKFFL